MTLKSGEVARRGGVNLQTIRYYERETLLPKPSRLPSGYRVFPESTVRRLRFIKRAQELGFSLAEIRELLSLRLDGGRSADVRSLAQAKVADIGLATSPPTKGMSQLCRINELIESVLGYLIQIGVHANLDFLNWINSIQSCPP